MWLTLEILESEYEDYCKIKEPAAKKLAKEDGISLSQAYLTIRKLRNIYARYREEWGLTQAFAFYSINCVLKERWVEGQTLFDILISFDEEDKEFSLLLCRICQEPAYRVGCLLCENHYKRKKTRELYGS